MDQQVENNCELRTVNCELSLPDKGAPLQRFSLEELTSEFQKLNIPAYRARQILEWVYKKKSHFVERDAQPSANIARTISKFLSFDFSKSGNSEWIARYDAKIFATSF